MASSAEKAKNDAYANREKAYAIQESNNGLILKLKSVVEMINSLTWTLEKLLDYFSDILDEMDDLVSKNNDYRSYSYKEKELVHRSLLMVQTIKNMISIPLLDENGAISIEAKKVRRKSEKMLRKIMELDEKYE